MISTFRVIEGDSRRALRELADESVQCVVTSPPYWGLRNYGHRDQIGLQRSPFLYVADLLTVFEEVWRILKPDGVLWLNLGDCYAEAGSGSPGSSSGLHGSRHAHQQVRDAIRATGRKWRPAPEGLKPKDLVGIPWMTAFALRDAGWYLRQENIWHKPNGMPESVNDRPTRAHEQLFLLSKSERYHYDKEAIAEPVAPETAARYAYGFQDRYANVTDARGYRGRFHGSEKPPPPSTRNKRTVWSINTQALTEAHFAPFPEELVLPCILAGSRPGDVVLDPFCGSGTTGVVATKHGRSFVGVEVNPEYVELSRRRIGNAGALFARETT